MRGLVLEGGGAKGSYELGCMLALDKMNINIDCVVGSSIGAVNGAFFASNQLDTLRNIWNDIDPQKFLGIKKVNKKNKKILDYLFVINKIIDIGGIDIDKFRQIILDNLNIDNLLNSKINFGLVTYNMTIHKELSLFKNKMNKDNVIDYIIASAYFPIFKFEKIIDNSYYLDGGISDNLPIKLLENKGFDEIIVIRTNKDKIKYKKDENIIEIKPSINLGNTIYFNKKQILRNIKVGYKDTLKKFSF